MSNVKGCAINGSDDILSLVINGIDTEGAAYGGKRFFTKGSELFSVVSVGHAVVGAPTQIVLSCNRKTVYVVTYTVSSTGGLSGISRANVAYSDTDDGRRNISFTVSFGTAGQRILRVYGASQSSSAANNRSVNYIDIPLVIGQSSGKLLMAKAPQAAADPFDYTISDRIISGTAQPDVEGLTARILSDFAEGSNSSNSESEVL